MNNLSLFSFYSPFCLVSIIFFSFFPLVQTILVQLFYLILTTVIFALFLYKSSYLSISYLSIFDFLCQKTSVLFLKYSNLLYAYTISRKVCFILQFLHCIIATGTDINVLRSIKQKYSRKKRLLFNRIILFG